MDKNAVVITNRTTSLCSQRQGRRRTINHSVGQSYAVTVVVRAVGAQPAIRSP